MESSSEKDLLAKGNWLERQSAEDLPEVMFKGLKKAKLPVGGDLPPIDDVPEDDI